MKSNWIKKTPNLQTLFYILPNLDKLINAIFAMQNQEILSTREHLKLCGDWFITAQEAEGGYAAWFSFVLGIRHAYIETTGYIIPTMFDLSVHLNQPDYRSSALKAGKWLLSVQQADGSFTDIDEYKLPQVFDTGQVMFGLNRLYRETNDVQYLDATRRAAEWLTNVQDSDGSWTTAGYLPNYPNTYSTRVASAMLESANLTGEDRHRESALRNLRWAASLQQPNGFFLNSELIPGVDPVLHTLVYVLEGFLLAYKHTKEISWLEILLLGAKPLLNVQLTKDIVLCSQYDANWQATNMEKCIPGLAQWAGLCLELHDITGELDWLEAAKLSIYYLKSKQIQGKGIMNGALPASLPLWGYYHPLILPNWTVKFFADALLLYDNYNFPVWKEQETWVAKCFSLKLDGGAWSENAIELGALDKIITDITLEQLTLLGKESGCALDLGCGEGRYLKYIQSQLLNWKVIGVDPSPGEDGEDRNTIKFGSAYKIPFVDEYFDAAYTWATLQHISDLPLALGELHRILKPGGMLVIGDRDLFSGRGLLKPWHELKGLWMYPWDSPFRERWYSVTYWKRILTGSGFEVQHCQRILNPGDRGWRRLVRMNSFFLLTVRKI
jgi:SAM-dependent methyltransferase